MTIYELIIYAYINVNITNDLPEFVYCINRNLNLL